MKIAIMSTISNYAWAGTEEVWAQFAQSALKQGHAVHASVHWQVGQSSRISTLRQLGLEVSVRQPFRPNRLHLLKERFYSDMLPLERFKPDIFLINSGSLFDVLNLPALRQFCKTQQIPTVFFCHFVAEGFVPHSPASVRDFADTMQGWIFVSKHNYRLAERQLAYPFQNAQVIVNGPRLSLEEPLSWPEGDTIQFGCVARLETCWKGQDVLLEVLSQPQWQARSWHLNLYGSGPDESYLRDLIGHYHLEKQVSIQGYCADIEAVWRRNHLMLLPSRGEGTPLAVLEAMMCGRPTVTTDVGGNREVLEHGHTGFIAEAATVNSFGKALEQAWSQQDRWQQMGTQAHRSAHLLAQSNPSQQVLDYLTKVIS
jgi:L-malate glycosyltransferase